MTRPSADSPPWALVDEGWGRKVVDFATLSEPANCREYVAMHHRLGVDAGGRLLDVACGAGLAVELARLRGCRDIPGTSPRPTRRDNGLGSPEGVHWSVGAGAVPPRCGGEGREPAVMVSLGRPGAGEQLLASHGFVDVERLGVPFAWEFADPELYARALASTGPAYEAIQNAGEAEFHRTAVERAQEQLPDGLPLRAGINVVGYLARKPEGVQRP